jgi:hypothetical protein
MAHHLPWHLSLPPLQLHHIPNPEFPTQHTFPFVSRKLFGFIFPAPIYFNDKNVSSHVSENIF